MPYLRLVSNIARLYLEDTCLYFPTTHLRNITLASCMERQSNVLKAQVCALYTTRRTVKYTTPNQSVSILSPPSLSLLACSCRALKNGSTPVPASAGRPRERTRSPSKPVRSAISKFRTAARNCGELTTRSSVSTFGGLGRSEGRYGKSDCTSSGCETKRGRMFAGVRTSIRPISGSCWVGALCARAPREETSERMRASSSGVAWYPPGCARDLAKRERSEWVGIS